MGLAGERRRRLSWADVERDIYVRTVAVGHDQRDRIGLLIVGRNSV